LNSHQQQGVITSAQPSLLVGSFEQSIDFGTVQEVNQLARVALPRYSQHALDLSGTGRFFISGIVEETADRCQP
jgi:hypothetical protein